MLPAEETCFAGASDIFIVEETCFAVASAIFFAEAKQVSSI